MLQYAQRKDVGAVGAKLYYADDTIQHAGVILGFRGLAGHAFLQLPKGEPGYMGRAIVVQNVSAVTAACMMMKKDLFDALGGFDETLKVAFNDIDLCMKIRESGNLIVFNPYAELYHHESVSRGAEDTKEKKTRFVGEIEYFNSKWKAQLDAGDPFYNPHLDLELTPYRISGK
jgi:GT2 family glycosyltransferase